MSVVAAAAVAVAAAAGGAVGGWFLGHRIKERPAALMAGVFCVALFGLGGFVAAYARGADALAFVMLGATFGCLGALKWASSDAYGMLEARGRAASRGAARADAGEQDVA